VYPTFVILSGTEGSDGSQSLRKIGILLLRYRYVQNDICKTEMHPVRFAICIKSSSKSVAFP